ncbi:hypothetical protein PAMA_003201 [Pampus argenteus]
MCILLSVTIAGSSVSPLYTVNYWKIKTDFERLFCCEQARQMRELILEEGGKLAQKESYRKIDVGPHVPIMREEEREAAKVRDYKYPHQETSNTLQKNLVMASQQMCVLSLYHQYGIKQQTHNESIPKNMQCELEMSPDNEALDSLRMENPIACQGETEEHITDMDNKLNQGKGLTLLGPDMLQRYLLQKSADISVLLQNIQSLITYEKTVRQQKVKPHQSLISQIERRWLPMKQTP